MGSIRPSVCQGSRDAPRDMPLGSSEEGFISLASNKRQRAAFQVGIKNTGIFQRKRSFPKTALWGSFPLNINSLLNKLLVLAFPKLGCMVSIDISFKKCRWRVP